MYTILEMQTSNGATAIVPPVVKDTFENAQNALFSACAAASISSVEIHTVLMIEENGVVHENRCFKHPVTA